MWYYIRMTIVIGALAIICWAYVSEARSNNKMNKKDEDKDDSA